jgi:hypothetical protein
MVIKGQEKRKRKLDESWVVALIGEGRRDVSLWWCSGGFRGSGVENGKQKGARDPGDHSRW